MSGVHTTAYHAVSDNSHFELPCTPLLLSFSHQTYAHSSHYKLVCNELLWSIFWHHDMFSRLWISLMVVVVLVWYLQREPRRVNPRNFPYHKELRMKCGRSLYLLPSTLVLREDSLVQPTVDNESTCSFIRKATDKNLGEIFWIRSNYEWTKFKNIQN